MSVFACAVHIDHDDAFGLSIVVFCSKSEKSITEFYRAGQKSTTCPARTNKESAKSIRIVLPDPMRRRASKDFVIWAGSFRATPHNKDAHQNNEPLATYLSLRDSACTTNSFWRKGINIAWRPFPLQDEMTSRFSLKFRLPNVPNKFGKILPVTNICTRVTFLPGCAALRWSVASTGLVRASRRKSSM
jgi:hypothetical protein